MKILIFIINIFIINILYTLPGKAVFSVENTVTSFYVCILFFH